MDQRPHPLLRAYFSVPVASSKAVSTFSYTGELITNRQNRLDAQLAEASTVVYDGTRQPDYSFESLMVGINETNKMFLFAFIFEHLYV